MRGLVAILRSCLDAGTLVEQRRHGAHVASMRGGVQGGVAVSPRPPLDVGTLGEQRFHRCGVPLCRGTHNEVGLAGLESRHQRGFGCDCPGCHVVSHLAKVVLHVGIGTAVEQRRDRVGVIL